MVFLCLVRKSFGLGLISILKMILVLRFFLYGDSAAAYQMGFQDPATTSMEGIYLLFVITTIVLLVGWLIFIILRNFTELDNSSVQNFTHSNPLEILCTSNSQSIPSESSDGFSKFAIIKDVLTFLLIDGGGLFFFLCEFFFTVSTLLLFTLLYLTTHKTDSFYKKFFEFYAPMPFINKMVLFGFSVSLAIPVKIWIKTTLPRILTTVITFVLIYLSTIFPLVAIFVFFQTTLLLSSLIFVFSYENSQSFKNFICKILFANNKVFASLYFDFFWGNMNSGNLRRAVEVVAGGTVTYLAREAHQKSSQEAENEGIVRASRAVKQSSEPIIPQEVYDLERKAVKEARSEHVILRVEDTLKEKAKEAGDWFFGS